MYTIGPEDGHLKEGVDNSSLTFLPLSSLTFNEKGWGSFASNHSNSLTTWFKFFLSAILIYLMFLTVTNLTHAFLMHSNLALVYPEFSQQLYTVYLLDTWVFATLKHTWINYSLTTVRLITTRVFPILLSTF